MTVNSAPPGTQYFLNGVAALQRAQARTQREISSGYRIQDASDSPSQVSELVALGSSLGAQQGWKTNLARVQTEVNSADTALSSAIQLVESARTIALQGGGTNLTATDRQNLADQVQTIQQQIVALANTTTEGRYIFGGDQDTSPPYQLAAGASTGVTQLTPQSATRTIVDPNGQPVFQSLTAAAIFDHQTVPGTPAADNVFAALESLRSALVANDATAAGNSLDALKSASDLLNQQQAYYGVAAQRITQAQTDNSARIVALQTRVSDIRDTDIVQAATDLTQESTAQTAAFSAQAQIPRKSLFEYLG